MGGLRLTLVDVEGAMVEASIEEKEEFLLSPLSREGGGEARCSFLGPRQLSFLDAIDWMEG